MKPPQAAPTPALHVSGILTFVIADMIIFGMLFGGFMVERSSQVPLFNQSAASLNLTFGIANTLILVTSGLFMVFAVAAAKQGKGIIFRRWIMAAFVVGAGFGINKVLEYHDKISHDITMLSNDFYMFYYALTGAHFLHFIAGMVALTVIGFRSLREPVDGKLYNSIESTGLYWHMVDLLWLLIFPILYLLRP